MSPLLSDVLSRLLPSDDPSIVDAGVCFGCHGNMLTSHCLTMDAFSGSMTVHRMILLVSLSGKITELFKRVCFNI
jgi:hypothetical protein